MKRIFIENEELVADLVKAFPGILEDRLGLRVKRVNWTSDIADWGEEEAKRVGFFLATFIRKRKTGEAALNAWWLHYVQMNEVFMNVDGFEELMVFLAKNILRDSIYGMVYRVSIGAALSTIDAATDIYVVTTYYQSDKLFSQAIALLAMTSANMTFQVSER